MDHVREWTALVDGLTGAAADERVRWLVDMNYSIHFHVWRAAELLELVVTLQRIVRFELELFLRNGHETILILRKTAS